MLTQEVVQTRIPYGAYLTTLTIKIKPIPSMEVCLLASCLYDQETDEKCKLVILGDEINYDDRIGHFNVGGVIWLG